MKKTYRVECNYGSKYFTNKLDAVIYFKYCVERKLDAELWTVVKDKCTPSALQLCVII